MPGQDSRSSAPGRKKLVLRKIAVDGASSAPEGWSNSYTGPLPVIRPPPKPRSAMAWDDASDAEPEILSEVMIEASWPAWSAAAMTPAAPRVAELVPAPFFGSERPPTPATIRTSDAGSRNTVAPVVATLPPAGMAPEPPRGWGRISLDSKVLAAGGVLTAAMLLVALGVFLGVHSTLPAARSATALGAYPVAVETKGVAATPVAAPVAVDVLPAAVHSLEKSAAAGQGDGVDRSGIPATIDVLQLPVAPRPPVRPATLLRGPRAPEKAAGWTVAAGPAERANEANENGAERVASPRATGEGAAATAPPVLEIPAAPPPPVDPFVQAVREDIREDEARSR